MSHVALALALGLAGGTLAGLFGVGGGIVFVPALTLGLGLSQLSAEATSLAAIVPVVAVGSFRQHRSGLVDWHSAGIIGACSLVGVLVGAEIALNVARDGAAASVRRSSWCSSRCRWRCAPRAPDAYGRGMSEYAWIPPEAWVENAHATALARSLGVDGYDELLALSTAEPERFWDAVARDLGIPFARRPTSACSTSRTGPAWARWFGGGRLNLANACVERWADDPAHAGRRGDRLGGRGGRHALAHLRRAGARGRALRRGPGGARRAQRRRGRAAPADGARGRDRATTRWPRSARSWCRSSRASRPRAVASRLEDSRAVALITVDAFMRRGRPVPAKATADEAAARAPGVRYGRRRPPHRSAGRLAGRARRLVARAGGRAARDAARDPGRERAPVHARLHLGHDRPAQGRRPRARRLPRQDRLRGPPTRATCRPGDRVHWVTDIGWIMGPWLLVERPRPRAHGRALRRRARLPRRRAASGDSPSATA